MLFSKHNTVLSENFHLIGLCSSSIIIKFSVIHSSSIIKDIIIAALSHHSESHFHLKDEFMNIKKGSCRIK